MVARCGVAWSEARVSKARMASCDHLAFGLYELLAVCCYGRGRGDRLQSEQST